MSEAMRLERELYCSASRSSDGRRTPSNSPSYCMKCWWLRSPRIWASSLRSSTRRSTTSNVHAAHAAMSACGIQRPASDDAAFEAAPLPLGQTAPDAEALVMGQRVFEASVAHLATQADSLGFAGRAALLGEKRLGVGLSAQSALLPLVLGVRIDSCRSNLNLLGNQTQLRASGGPQRCRSGMGVRCSADRAECPVFKRDRTIEIDVLISHVPPPHLVS